MNVEQIWVWDSNRCFLIDVCKHILTLSHTHIVYGAAEEYTFPHRKGDDDAVSQILPTVKQHMTDNAVTLDFISTANNYTQHNYRSINKFKLWEMFNIISWPTSTMLIARQNFVNRHYVQNEKTFPYVCLNNNLGIHRNLLIDHIASHHCVEKGLWSFHSPLGSDHYRWWLPQKLTLPENTNNSLMWKNLGPAQYNNAFCDIVCETEPTVPHYTEKTARPIYTEIPFIVVGCVGANTQLTEYGFELYNEIWDYSFDIIDNLEDRIIQIAQQVKWLCDLSIAERNALQKKIQPKLLHNKQVLMALEMTNIPPPQAYQFSRYRETILSGATA